MASEGLHEPLDSLTPEVIDRHRAIRSIMEEFEAVDWYDQRVAATGDADLAGILGHNRDEEKEHMAMTLEWLRRHDETLDQHLRTYLFSEGSVLEIEDSAEHSGGDAVGDGADRVHERSSGDESLAIGSLRSEPSDRV